MGKEMKFTIDSENIDKLELLKNELNIGNNSDIVNFLIDSFHKTEMDNVKGKALIDKEYFDYLEKQDNQLTYLEVKGVDNWGEYSKYQFDEEYCEEYDLEYEG